MFHRCSSDSPFYAKVDVKPFGPLLQGQMRTAKLKSAYNLLIIGPRGLGW